MIRKCINAESRVVYNFLILTSYNKIRADHMGLVSISIVTTHAQYVLLRKFH